MLIFILVHAQFLQNVVFTFEKSLNGQNHLKFPWPNEKFPQEKFILPLERFFPHHINHIWKTLYTYCVLYIYIYIYIYTSTDMCFVLRRTHWCGSGYQTENDWYVSVFKAPGAELKSTYIQEYIIIYQKYIYIHNINFVLNLDSNE